MSSVENIKTDLELDEHLDLHEKGWKLQRWGWALIFLFVTLSAFGMFGDGVISKVRQTQPSFELNYDRFHRFEARLTLEVSVSHNPDSVLQIAFDNEYLKKFELKSIFPEPLYASIQQDQVHYRFRASGPSHVIFYFSPQSIGSVEGHMKVNNQSVSLNHFIFP